MAGGPNAEVVMCGRCLGRAVRTSEGLEDDWYACEACGATFGVDWSRGAPAQPCWPPSAEQLALARRYQAMLRGDGGGGDAHADPP